MSLCLDDIIKRYNDKNIRLLQVCSICCFFVSVLLIFYLEDVFYLIGGGPGKEADYKVTTLGISATIMTLYNMIAWPHIHEKSEKIRIHSVKTEMGRAKELYKNLDLIVDFISSIMGQIKDLASGGMQEEEEVLNFNHGYCRIYDQSNELMVEARIKQLDANGMVYGNYSASSNSSKAPLAPHLHNL